MQHERPEHEHIRCQVIVERYDIVKEGEYGASTRLGVILLVFRVSIFPRIGCFPARDVPREMNAPGFSTTASCANEAFYRFGTAFALNVQQTDVGKK